MSEYTFKSEEPVWYRSEWSVEKDEDGEPIMNEDNGRVVDSYGQEGGYYWIVSEERDDVLIVPSFMEGEKALMELQTTQKMFEDFVDNDEEVVGFEIVDDVREVY